MTRLATPKPRSTYRHGDLRRALLEAAIELARQGGPAAVVLRETTRRAGVAPNAAYRHFESREDLLAAVRAAALSALAQAIESELDKINESLPAADYARASLRAVGTGYLRFARREPGLFRTAFTPLEEPFRDAYSAEKKGGRGRNPFELLSDALDRMAKAGLLTPERRFAAEYLAWSSVHGLAMLVIDGPLRSFSPAQMEAVGQRLIDMVERGL